MRWYWKRCKRCGKIYKGGKGSQYCFWCGIGKEKLILLMNEGKRKEREK